MLSAMGLDVQAVTFNGVTVDAVKDQYIVRMPQLNAASATSPLDYESRQPAIRKTWSIETLGNGFYKLTAPGASTTNIMAWAAGQQALYIEPNAVHATAGVPNDPLYSAKENWVFPRIEAEKAWDTNTGSSRNVVAVLDTGIDATHVDLQRNMWRNLNEVPGDGIDNDGNGYVDDYYGFNAVATNGDVRDVDGHGTFSAGLIGAVGNNGTGMAGVNWNVRMMAVKVFNTYPSSSNVAASSADIIRGLNYVIKVKVGGEPISTVSCGFAGNQFNQSEFDAVQSLGALGVLIVCPAGNDASDNDANPRYPANYAIKPTTSLISVAATDFNGVSENLAPFSNFGAATVDIAAPGVGILSTRSANAANPPFGPYLGTNPDYTIHSGTSYASALVAGAAALLKSVKPTASPAEIKTAILTGADAVSSLNGLVKTAGRLNVVEAVNRIKPAVVTLPNATFKTGQASQFIEGDTGYSIAEVRIVLDRAVDPGQTAEVFYRTVSATATSGVDFLPQSGSVTFSGAQRERLIRLKIIGDRVPEPDESFLVQLDPTLSRGVVVGTASASVTIADDDATLVPAPPNTLSSSNQPLVSIAQTTGPGGFVTKVMEGDDAQFIVRLDRTSTQPVTVNYRTIDPVVGPVNRATPGSDYTAQSGTLTFNPGESAKIITIKTLRDRLNEIYPAGTPGLFTLVGGPASTSIDYEVFSVVLSEPVNAALAGATSIVTSPIFNVAPAAPKPPASGGGFKIDVNFASPSGLTASQQAVFAKAAARWEQIIIGDLPDVVDPATGRTIDDVVIDASAVPIDGVNGILGQAGPREVRPGAGGLPWKGVMQFDTADVAALEQSGQLLDVILHEMAHVLGFGSIWSDLGLLQGEGTPNPTYTGANAIREYNAIFGQTGSGVPVENTGGPGTADAHWRESILGSELMTGYLNPGVPNLISRVTVGQFQDLGYQVDYSKADAYVPIRGLAAGRPLPLVLPTAAVLASTSPTSGSTPSGGSRPRPSTPLSTVPPTPVAPQSPVGPSPAPQRIPVTRIPSAASTASASATATQLVSASASIARPPVTSTS